MVWINGSTSHSPYLKQENNSLFCIEESPDSFVIKTEDKLDPEEQEQYVDDFSMITPYDLQRYFDLQSQTSESDKDLICYVEGKTDVEYINHGLNIHDKKCILNSVDIFDLGGKDNLDRVFAAEKMQREKLGRIAPNILFIYDCDAKMKKKYDEKIGLFVEQIPPKENGKIKKGIENLLSDLSIENAYKDKIITLSIEEQVEDDSGNYHEEKSYVVKDNEKRRLQEWVCEQPKDVENFEEFKVIISIIESTLQKLS